jgi:hypothetical protein
MRLAAQEFSAFARRGLAYAVVGLLIGPGIAFWIAMFFKYILGQPLR